MDWSALFDYLGAGGGLLVVLNWIVGLPVLRKKTSLDKDDVSRHMADKDNRTIIELYDQVRTFQERLSYVEGCITKIVACPIYDKCPARAVVQDYKRKYFDGRDRKCTVEQKGNRHPRDNPTKPGTINCSGGEPP